MLARLQTPGASTEKTLRAIAAFPLGWLAVCLLAPPLLPLPHLPVLSEKRAHFLAHAARYDVAFIGSSRVYRGFVPAVFDGEMRSLGHPTRSFNFAMEAVWPPESLFRVREFLRMRSRVRWLFIELLPVNPRINPENTRALRSIYWHDWRYTALAWRAVLNDETIPAREKCGLLALHGDLFLRRLSNVSRAAAALAPQLVPEMAKTARKEFDFNTPWIAGEGFLPEPDIPMRPTAAAAFRHQAAAYAAQDLPPFTLPEYFRNELRDLATTVRAAGVVPIFIITPSITRTENFADLRSQGIDADLISFKDPAGFPALYDPTLHFDGPHLNARGASELSRRLAHEFAALLPPGGASDHSPGSAR